MPGPRDLLRFLMEEGRRAASRAAGAALHSPLGQEAVARAVGAAQRGRQRLEKVQERLLHAVGLPARQDYDEVVKQMARVKRKLREVARRVENGEARRDAPR